MPNTVQITIDGKEVTVPKGTLLIEACKSIATEVPAFCYWPGLSLQAACRMCLVRVEKIPKLATACTTVAMDGMVVSTDTPEIHEARKSMLEFLLTNHPLDCPVCDKGGECELQDMVFRYGAAESRFIEEKEHQPEQQFSPVVYFDAARCILCFRCVRVCDEGMDVNALGVGRRGVRSVIIPNLPDGTLDCEECGMCVDICPVGALTSDQYRYKTRPWEMTYVATPCAHCADGCKTTLSIRNNQIQRGTNRDQSGNNGEFLCVKGRYAGDFTHHPDRLSYPLIRRNPGEELRPADWPEAIDFVTRRLKKITEEYGPESVGFIGSNHTSNEESYLLNRFARSVIGTNNLDHHRTADYAGLIAAISGSNSRLGATTDITSTDAILVIGSDPTEAHPLLAWKIREAIRHRHTPLYLINASEIKLERKATTTARIQTGTEASAVRALLKEVNAGSGASSSADKALEAATRKTLKSIRAALKKATDVFIAFGPELTGAAITDLIALGDSLPGTTRIVALGDYANSRGAADMGLLPDSLPGYVNITDAPGRARFEQAWGASIPNTVGLSADEMLSSERLRCLYVVGANPVKTFSMEPSRDALGSLDLLVVHDLFLTETAKLADVVLPAASAYEKEGTITNTCGEVQQLRMAVQPDQVRTDFDLLRLLSHALGKPMHYTSPEAVFREIARLVPGYDVPLTDLAGGGALHTNPTLEGAAAIAANGNVFSSGDTLFTSGTLGEFSNALKVLRQRADDRERN